MHDDVMSFWFKELEPKMWWKKSDEFDATIKSRFSSLHSAASKGELFSWRESAQGSLAEVIVLDQFSRNMYRDTLLAFQYDSTALVLSQIAIDKGFDKTLPDTERLFFYMPFMHSESALIHEQALRLFTELGLENNLKFERAHKTIIDRFGRYPHRNEILGRKSTAEEVEFLKTPGSGF